MKKRFLSIALVLCMLLTMLPITALASDAPASTAEQSFTVDGTGYATIQEAVGALKDGSTMTIAAGEYDVTTPRTSKTTYGTCFIITENNVTIKAADPEKKPVIYGFSNEFNAGVDSDGINGQDTIYVSGNNVTLKNLVIMPLGGIGENANNWQKTVEVTSTATGFKMTGCETRPNNKKYNNEQENSMQETAGNIHVSIDNAAISGNSFGEGTTISAGWVDGVSADNTYTVDVSDNYWGENVTTADLAGKIDGNVIIDTYYTDAAMTETVSVGGIPVSSAEQLVNAITSAKTGDTIVLGADIELTETVTIPEGKDVIINGNNHELTFPVTSAGGSAFSVSTNATEVKLTVKNIAFVPNGENLGEDGEPLTGFGILVGESTDKVSIAVDSCSFSNLWSGVYFGHVDTGKSGSVSITNSTYDNTKYGYSVDEVTAGSGVGAVNTIFENNGDVQESESWSNIVLEHEGSKVAYRTLAEAIAAAESGDTITLGSGIFTMTEDECFTLDKKLTIQGAGENTIIKGTGTQDYGNGLFTFAAGSEGSVLKDLTINYTATGAQRAAVMFTYGFKGDKDSVTKIQNVDFIGAKSLETIMDEKASGISSAYIDGGFIEISGCSFQNFAYGMYFNGIHDLTITENSIDGTKYNAINIAGDNEEYVCNNIAIQDNELTNISYANYDSDIYSSGIRIGLNSDAVSLENNQISMLNNKSAIYFDPVEEEETPSRVVVRLKNDDVEIGAYVLKPDEGFTLPEAPEKAGYTFLGWKYGDKTAKAGDKVTISEDTVFEAQWEKIVVTKITLNETTLTLVEGGTATLTATVEPDNVPDKTVTWSSSDEKVATVDKDGVVTAVAEGTATITATAGDKTATCKVTVTKAEESVEVTSITLNKTSTTLIKGESETLTTTVKPDNATDKTITWSSSDETIATVESGKIEATGYGVVTITARSGDQYATCEVSVICDDEECQFYTDINEDAWYHAALDYVTEYKVMQGIGNKQFAPESSLTRAQLVQILYNMEGKPAYTVEDEFPDVQEKEDGQDVWYYDAVMWAASEGIVKGYEDKEFKPDREITRQEMVTIMRRYAVDYKQELDGEVTEDLDQFEDSDSAGVWDKASFAWAVQNGIVNGKDGNLAPVDNARRAEAAKIMMVYCVLTDYAETLD